MSVNRMSAGTAVCCAVLIVSACGGGTSATGPASGTRTTAPSGGAAGSAARAFPGATGLLAQIDGATLQVQGSKAQTAVTYSRATTFTETVAARLSDVVVGVCVQTRSARVAAGAAGASPTDAPNAVDAPIAAASVEISAAVEGSCSAPGGLRTPGARPPGAAGDGTPPSGSPTFGRARGQGGGGNGSDGNGSDGNGFGVFGAFGRVTAVNGAGFTVESPRRSTATGAAPTTRTVKTSAATTYTRTRAAGAKALAVGLCITALGKADDTGSVAATSIVLRPAENGSCSSGLNRRPSASPTSTGGGPGG